MITKKKSIVKNKQAAYDAGRRKEVQWLIWENERELMDFYSKYLPTWERFQELWKWRKSRLPGSGYKTAIVAICDEEIIGSVGVVPAIMTLSGIRFNALWLQDTLISPSMRGSGLSNRLAEAASKDCDIAMAKGATALMHKIRKSFGFKDVPSSNCLLHVRRPLFSFKRLHKSIVELVLSISQSFFCFFYRNSGVPVTRIEAFDTTFDALAEKMALQDTLRVYKDSAYLNWRYFTCPGRDYRVFRAGGDGARAAIVVKVAGSEMDEGWIVDLICSDEDKDAAYSLIREAMRFFDKESVRRIWVFATLPTARRWFYRFGFFPTTYNPRFYYRVSSDDLRKLLNIKKNWDFWHGDGDLELY